MERAGLGAAAPIMAFSYVFQHPLIDSKFAVKAGIVLFYAMIPSTDYWSFGSRGYFAGPGHLS